MESFNSKAFSAGLDHMENAVSTHSILNMVELVENSIRDKDPKSAKLLHAAREMLNKVSKLSHESYEKYTGMQPLTFKSKQPELVTSGCPGTGNTTSHLDDSDTDSPNIEEPIAGRHKRSFTKVRRHLDFGDSCGTSRSIARVSREYLMEDAPVLRRRSKRKRPIAAQCTCQSEYSGSQNTTQKKSKATYMI